MILPSKSRNKILKHYDSSKKNFFDQPVKKNMGTYDNISKIATDQGDDYTTGGFLDYNNFNKHCKMIATELSKQ